MRRCVALGLLWLAGFGPPPSGTWVGSYFCAQGPTGLSLHLQAGPDGGLRGVFHFYADPRNPGVPEGCYAMRGQWDAGSGAINLQATGWLLQPPGYVTVDLSGLVGPQSIGGTVLGPGCSTFELVPASGPEPLPLPCRPTGPPPPSTPHPKAPPGGIL